MHSFMSHDKEKHETIENEFCQRVFTAIWKLANNGVSNFALRYHKDIDHWVIYHLKNVCEMGRRSFTFHELMSFLVVLL